MKPSRSYKHQCFNKKSEFEEKFKNQQQRMLELQDGYIKLESHYEQQLQQQRSDNKSLENEVRQRSTSKQNDTQIGMLWSENERLNQQLEDEKEQKNFLQSEIKTIQIEMTREKEKRKLLENQISRLTEELSRYLSSANLEDDEEDEKSVAGTHSTTSVGGGTKTILQTTVPAITSTIPTTAPTTAQQSNERSWVGYFTSAASNAASSVSIATSRIVGNVGTNNNDNNNHENQQSKTGKISNALRRLSDASKTAVLKNASTQKNNTSIPSTISE